MSNRFTIVSLGGTLKTLLSHLSLNLYILNRLSVNLAVLLNMYPCITLALILQSQDTACVVW